MGLFVAGGKNAAAYSSDGITWTSVAIPISDTIRAIVYSKEQSRWVAVGNGAMVNMAYSTTGTGGWTAVPSSTSVSMNPNNGVAWNPTAGRFLVCGKLTSGRSISYSLDGINWITLGAPVFNGMQNECKGVRSTNGRYILTGRGSNNYFVTSDDGATFTGRGFGPFTTRVNKVRFGQSIGTWIAAGAGTYQVGFSSNNGANWNPISTNIFTEGLDVEVDYPIANTTTREAKIRRELHASNSFRRRVFQRGF